MKLLIAASSLVFSSLVLATQRASYDTVYDNASSSMNTVACSDGPHGLAKKYPTFSNLPTFPNIGGASAIAGWNSVNCGTCWNLTFEGVSILVTAIDQTDDGFNLAEEALNTLTDGNAEWYGAVQADAAQVDKSLCGL